MYGRTGIGSLAIGPGDVTQQGMTADNGEGLCCGTDSRGIKGVLVNDSTGAYKQFWPGNRAYYCKYGSAGVGGVQYGKAYLTGDLRCGTQPPMSQGDAGTSLPANGGNAGSTVSRTSKYPCRPQPCPPQPCPCDPVPCQESPCDPNLPPDQGDGPPLAGMRGLRGLRGCGCGCGSSGGCNRRQSSAPCEWA